MFYESDYNVVSYITYCKYQLQ